MASCKSVYDPQEDSTMLERWVRQYARGKVLDIGTGSGIQAIAAAHSQNVKSVTATDVQKEVVAYCKKNIKNKKIKFMQSDLFKKIKGKFDTIVFNPPYLPQELKLKDLTVDGGKQGYEIIEKFLDGVNDFLEPDGNILLVFSSLTRKGKVEEFIKNSLLDFNELEKAHIFFEDIYIYLLKKSEFLKRLESKKISKAKYLAKGHRGLLFTGIFKGKKVAIKAKNPKSSAVGRIENEAKWLKALNKSKIGPKLLFAEMDYFAYGYVNGDLILEYIKKSAKSSIIAILRKLYRQMRLLDMMKIEKGEMHHPLKHIIIERDNPVLIDFERARYSPEPKNVTQFCQFLMSQKTSILLREKGIFLDNAKLMSLAKIYKSSQNSSNFRKIIGLL